MNDDPSDLLEQELLRLRPAKPPADLMTRMSSGPPAGLARSHRAVAVPRIFKTGGLGTWLRLLVPAGAAALLVAAGLVLQARKPSPARAPEPEPLQTATPLTADDVSVDSQLLSSFDAVAELPGGEPVRVWCREWVDNIKVRDADRGVTIEQRKPRMEIVPVRFETY